MNYNTDEKKLKKDFEIYGPIKRVRIVRDKDGKSRGYGFIEYEHKADFKTAYKRAENRRIDNTPVQVDYERGRTEKNWKPRRLGGDKGNIRELPGWLERELRKIKEMYPELTHQYKKQEITQFPSIGIEQKLPEPHLKKKRSRSRSRDKNTNVLNISEEKKESLNKDMDVYKQEYNLNFHVFEENKFDAINDKIEEFNMNHLEVFTEKINLPQEDKTSLEMNDDVNSGKSEDFETPEKLKKKKKGKKEKKDKKHKKDKKEKKHKKDKKEKKAKKDKKERKERRTPELEVGEIV